MKQSLALTLSSGKTPYVDIKLEKLTLTPQKKNPEQIEMSFVISGHEVDVDQTLKRSDLLAGKALLVNVPQKVDKSSFLSITSHGHFTLRYDKKNDQLFIEKALAHAQIENPMSEDETEEIQFSGKAVRP